MNQILAFDTTLVWIIFVNSLAAGLFFLAATRIPAGRVRLSFLGMLLASLVYLNPAIYFWHPLLGLETKLIFSRLVFAGSLLLAASVTVFLLYFTENEGELRRWRFRFFIGSVLLFLGANAAGLVVTEVVTVGESVRLAYGPLHKPLVFGFLAYFVYFSFLGWRGYRRCQSEMLQVQLKTLSLAGALTFGAIVFTNGIIPLITGSSSFSPLAALAVLVFYSAILYIVLNGETLVVIRSVRNLLKEPSFALSENRQALRMYIHHLKYIVTNDPGELHRKIAFQTAGGRASSFFISKGERFEVGPISFDEGIPREWYVGVQRTAARLEQENMRLSIGLEAAKMVMHENRIEPPAAVAEPAPLPHPVAAPLYLVSETEDLIESLVLELKHPGKTFTRQQALDVLHEDEFRQELEKGTILPVSDRLFRIATPQRYLRFFPKSEWEADFH